MEAHERLARVRRELERYEHPLFDLDAVPRGDAVELVILLKDRSLALPRYSVEFHPRDIDHPQFPWTFQRQLYDSLHDYVCKMFTRNPQQQ